MIMHETPYSIWVDWEKHIVSLCAAAGFERICFFSRERYRENLRILTQSGFQLQGEIEK